MPIELLARQKNVPIKTPDFVGSDDSIGIAQYLPDNPKLL